ncbi:IS3 family transposase [Variovorax sp. 22077]|jgi:putative transposase|uniref:IS3 family transposase n=1 Tax=Variovorax sp. 22077 TaxID=3453867 RepID=UPI003F85DD50
MKMSASTDLYKPVKKDESALKMRIKEITATHRHYGYRWVHVLLRREGHIGNVKRIYRLAGSRGCHCA